MTLGRRPHSRLMGGLAAGAVLSLAATIAPAHADGVAGYDDPPTTYCGSGADTSALAPGQELHGWTVVDGSTPVEFTASVMGVLKQGIDPSTDLILVDAGDPDPGPGEGDAADMTLTGNAAIERAGGIWEGMSGSPVYDSTGQLVGAISYGLSYGPSHVIGLTPYSAMQKYADGGTSAPATPARVPVKNRAMATRIAKTSGTTTAQAAQGFTPLAVPTTVSGVAASRLKAAASTFRKTKSVHTAFTSDAAGGRTEVAAPDTTETLTGGDNIGAMDVYGDITEGGVGTVTAVCDDNVVAYGHPQDDTGKTSVALLTEDAIGVQDDSLGAPFKITNNGDVIGEITGDHTTGISGEIGTPPAAPATFTGTATYDHGAATTLTSYSATPQYWADAAYYDLVGASDVADQAEIPGGASVDYTIKGIDGSTGKHFTLTHADRYAERTDVAGQAGFDLGNLVYAMSGIRNLTLTSVTASMSVDDNDDVWRLAEVDQRVRGHWAKVSGTVVAPAGKTVRLRGILQDKATGTAAVVPIALSIPAKAAGQRGQVEVVGGNSLFDYPGDFASVAAARAYVDALVPHDALLVATTLIGKKATRMETTTPSTGKVVGGAKRFSVIVR